MPILGLIWGLISRAIPWLLSAVASATTAVVASRAATTVAVAAAITAFVLWMPMPGWVQQIPALVSQIPPSVVYVMGYARVAEGVTIVVSAYVIRFVARLVLKAMTAG